MNGLQVLTEMQKPIVLYVENQAAIAFERDAPVHRHNKHIDSRLPFTSQVVEDGILEIRYCPIDVMIVNMVTKTLGRIKL